MIEYDEKNWLSILFRMEGAVVPRVLLRVLISAAIGGGAAYLYMTRGIKLAPTVHAVVGIALSLLLVFRIHIAYERYWEGRKLLGNLVNRARDLVRQISAFVEGDDPSSTAERLDLRRYVVAFYALSARSLRSDRDLDALGGILSKGERMALEPVMARHCALAVWISGRLVARAKAGKLTEQRLQLMDQNLTSMIDAIGSSERILKTPIPIAYAQHLKMFLTLFCWSIPFTMVESMRWFTPLASAALSYALFGIDEIGVEIEAPFGYDANDLPLDQLALTIDKNTSEMIAPHVRRQGFESMPDR